MQTAFILFLNTALVPLCPNYWMFSTCNSQIWLTKLQSSNSSEYLFQLGDRKAGGEGVGEGKRGDPYWLDVPFSSSLVVKQSFWFFNCEIWLIEMFSLTSRNKMLKSSFVQSLMWTFYTPKMKDSECLTSYY